jgi:predicted homoserine dehydrogenase-like protein
MGSGPYYRFYRPYHLCNIETPIAVADAVLNGETTVVPSAMVSEVVSLAKRNLKVGDRVGEIGGPDIYNLIYPYDEAKSSRGIPMGLATGGKVLKDIAKGEMLTQDNFAPNESLLVYKLRQMQDAIIETE